MHPPSRDKHKNGTQFDLQILIKTFEILNSCAYRKVSIAVLDFSPWIPVSCFFPKKISDILEPGYQADAQRIPDTGSEDVVFNLLDVNNHETSLLFVSQGLEDLSPSPPSKQRKVTRWTHIISVRFLPFSSYELPTCHFSRFRGDVLDLEMFYLQLLNDTPTALTYQKQHVLFQRTLVNCGMAWAIPFHPRKSHLAHPHLCLFHG